MSRYARKLEKMESGKWFMKSVVLLGSGILCMVLLELLGSLGSAVSADFLEAMAETLSGGVFLVYLVGVLALYTVTGTWGYILHLFKEAFLLPWRFTPVIVLAWVFFVIELAIGFMLMAVVEIMVLFCPPLVLHLARNHFEAKCGVGMAW